MVKTSRTGDRRLSYRRFRELAEVTVLHIITTVTETETLVRPV
jgi:hypothetical protein